jgi:hypothetical protein
MARPTNHQLERKRKEQARAERAAARRARKQTRGPGEQDPDLDGIVPGPQQREAVSDAEVMRAVERAMNPGGFRAKEDDQRTLASGGKRLFVGNLDFGTEEEELRQLFVEAGFTVVKCTLVSDRQTGQPRGFAFVELANSNEAARAIDNFNGAQFRGRPLRINEAEDKRR